MGDIEKEKPSASQVVSDPVPLERLVRVVISGRSSGKWQN